MPSILIVDDDPTIRMMFARALKPFGDVETAANGADALRALGSKKYGVVLLDLHMPIIDGFILLQTLSTKPGPNKDTPIFVITADTSEQARIKALRRHAVFLLTKPVPIATLTSLVESSLKKTAARAAPGAAAAAPAANGVLDLHVDLPGIPAPPATEDGGPPSSSTPAPPSSATGVPATAKTGAAMPAQARPPAPVTAGPQAGPGRLGDQPRPPGGSKKPGA